MADKKKICEAEENPTERSELQEPSQQESLQPEQTSPTQQSTSEQSPERSPASTLQQDTPRWLSEQSSPNFNPALLTVEEQIAYLTHKYSSMDEPVCHIDAMRRRPGPPPQTQPSPVLHSRLPSLGSPERRKLHYEMFLNKCRQFNSPTPVQHSLPPSWQAVQQYSSQIPPESQSENFSQEKVQGWISTLRKHEKGQDEKTKKEQEEKAKAKEEQAENVKMEHEEVAKKEQEEKMELSEEEQYKDVDSPKNPDI